LTFRPLADNQRLSSEEAVTQFFRFLTRREDAVTGFFELLLLSFSAEAGVFPDCDWLIEAL